MLGIKDICYVLRLNWGKFFSHRGPHGITHRSYIEQWQRALLRGPSLPGQEGEISIRRPLLNTVKSLLVIELYCKCFFLMDIFPFKKILWFRNLTTVRPLHPGALTAWVISHAASWATFIPELTALNTPHTHFEEAVQKRQLFAAKAQRDTWRHGLNHSTGYLAITSPAKGTWACSHFDPGQGWSASLVVPSRRLVNGANTAHFRWRTSMVGADTLTAATLLYAWAPKETPLLYPGIARLMLNERLL